MANKLSIQEYYYQQRRIAETYGIHDNHAGCYIAHYPNEDLCGQCKHVKSCMKIRQQENDKGYA